MASWKPLVSGLALLGLAGWWWTRRESAGPSVPRWARDGGLVVIDHATGRPIRDAVWTLVAARKEGFDEGTVGGVVPAGLPAEKLAEARRVAIGAYGYEVRVLDREALDVLGGRVDLEPVVDVAPLRLECDDGAVDQVPVVLMFSLRDPAAPSSAVSLWWLHREVALTRTPIDVPVSRDQGVLAVTTRGSVTHVLWPYPARLSPRRPTAIHAERTRRIAFETSEGPHDDASVHAGFLHVDPRKVGDLGDDRRSGLALHAGGGGYEASTSMRGLYFDRVPRVPLTGVVRTAAGWFAVELDDARETLPVRAASAPVRRLTTVSIDGEPPPHGAVVLPGTLSDDLVNAVLVRGWLDAGGLGLRAPKSDAWQETRLPAADALTVWHPERGLARLRWGESGAAVGSWEPGFVHVRRHPGCRSRAALSVRSGCVGSALVTTGTSRRDEMERPLPATPETLAGGIPFGRVALELRTWAPGEAGPSVVQQRLVLDATAPCARFTLAEDGRVTFDGTGPAPFAGTGPDDGKDPVRENGPPDSK